MRLSQQYPQKRAFVTGAASGLGLALCRRLAADGWTLGMNDVETSELERAMERVRQTGGQPVGYPFDVADGTAFREAAEAFVSEAGGVDVVINNAGIGVAGQMEDIAPAVWQEAIGVNLMGVVHGCHAFLPHLKAARAGRIVNVASIAAVTAAPRMATYNASKAAVLALSETLYAELWESGVGVTVVLPFFFQTNLARRGPGAWRRPGAGRAHHRALENVGGGRRRARAGRGRARTSLRDLPAKSPLALARKAAVPQALPPRGRPAVRTSRWTRPVMRLRDECAGKAAPRSPYCETAAYTAR